jgi:hypothetical protein
VPRGTPEAVLQSIVNWINAGDLDSLMALYEPSAGLPLSPAKQQLSSPPQSAEYVFR